MAHSVLFYREIVNIEAGGHCVAAFELLRGFRELLAAKAR